MLPVKGADCSTAFDCEVGNYQRMYLDGPLQELESERFGFKLEGEELVPQLRGSPLVNRTLNYEL